MGQHGLSIEDIEKHVLKDLESRPFTTLELFLCAVAFGVFCLILAGVIALIFWKPVLGILLAALLGSALLWFFKD